MDFILVGDSTMTSFFMPGTRLLFIRSDHFIGQATPYTPESGACLIVECPRLLPEAGEPE